MSTIESRALARYFRVYGELCESPSEDSLFLYLETMHGLQDKATEKLKIMLYRWDEYIALKCLRNFYHHHDEVRHEHRIMFAERMPPMIADLVQLILVRRDDLNAAYSEEKEKYKEQVAKSADAVFAYFANSVSINPAVFNLTVRIGMYCSDAYAELDSKYFKMLVKQFDYEKKNGHDHFVSKGFTCHAGSVDEIVDRLFTFK